VADRPTFDGLARASRGELEALLRRGVTPDPRALVGGRWRGCNVGVRMRLLGLQKFLKGFTVDPEVAAGATVEGHNVRVRQDGLANPWIPAPNPERARPFGFFLVLPPAADGPDARYPNALLLDYGASPRNPRRSPTRVIRDHLVQPDPENGDLMLGKAYLAVGGWRVPSNFFVIERLPR
jgi:hypothetical protein